jgi:hypothetical protein
MGPSFSTYGVNLFIVWQCTCQLSSGLSLKKLMEMGSGSTCRMRCESYPQREELFRCNVAWGISGYEHCIKINELNTLVGLSVGKV